VALNKCCGSPIAFNSDPDTAFYLNADPDPGLQTNADPDPGQTFKKQKVEFLHGKYKYLKAIRKKTYQYLRRNKSLFERQKTQVYL
jgi:hypothetical protein